MPPATETIDCHQFGRGSRRRSASDVRRLSAAAESVSTRVLNPTRNLDFAEMRALRLARTDHPRATQPGVTASLVGQERCG